MPTDNHADTEALSLDPFFAGNVPASDLPALTPLRANVLALPASEDADLAYITSPVAAGQAIGRPSLEALNLLLTKYRERQKEFDDALVSGSEFRIRQASAKYSRKRRGEPFVRLCQIANGALRPL
jgi:hypothetical protein